jgi:hypothetical protein
LTILIQYFKLNTNPIRIQNFYDKKFRKIIAANFIFKFKIAIYLSIGLHKGRPGYRRSLQHFKTSNFLSFFYFCGSFLPFWIRSRNPNPESDPDLIESAFNPDPKHCYRSYLPSVADPDSLILIGSTEQP